MELHTLRTFFCCRSSRSRLYREQPWRQVGKVSCLSRRSDSPLNQHEAGFTRILGNMLRSLHLLRSSTLSAFHLCLDYRRLTAFSIESSVAWRARKWACEAFECSCSHRLGRFLEGKCVSRSLHYLSFSSTWPFRGLPWSCSHQSRGQYSLPEEYRAQGGKTFQGALALQVDLEAW